MLSPDRGAEDIQLLEKFLEKIQSQIRFAGEKKDTVDTRSHKEIAIEQYRLCVGILSDFFVFVPNGDWIYDGIGSCNIPETHSEMGLDGPFMRDILKLREQLRPKSLPVHHACVYHKQGIGCILGDLKSPLCVAFAEGDLPEEYDEYVMRRLLGVIQAAGGKPGNMFRDTNPSKNRNVVELFLGEVKKCTLALKH